MSKKYKPGMILISRRKRGKFDDLGGSGIWILRRVLKTPVDNSRLVCEDLYSGQKVMFAESNFSFGIDLNEILFLDCEAKEN